MQSSLQESATRLQHAVDEIKEFRAGIWTLRDGLLLEVEVNSRRGADNKGQWKLYPASTHWKIFHAPATNPVQWCCQTGCPLNGIPQAFEQLSAVLDRCTPLIDSIAVRACAPDAANRNTPDWEQTYVVDTQDPLYCIAREVWQQFFSLNSSSSLPSNVNPELFRQDYIREPLLNFLAEGSEGISKWNETPQHIRSFPGYSYFDWSNCQLPEINLRELDLRGCKFNSAMLRKSVLICSDLTGACLQEANLEKSDLCGARAEGTDFTAARLHRADLRNAKLQQAIFSDADLTKSDFRRADIRNVDLSRSKNCNLANFKGAIYNEATILPADFEHSSDLIWSGRGSDPYKLRQKQLAQKLGSVDFNGLMARLHESFDKARVQKALSMLKKDSYQLFFETSSDSVTGVVKSQSDDELVYACRLQADGCFTCCTNKLNACGGLRGALCKHVLVLIIGLAKTNELNTTDAARWILASIDEKPQLDRDHMMEIFLKYHAAQSGTIDWRPTETVPEDYYAF